MLTICSPIVAGNTAFPALLRGIIWILYKTLPPTSRLRESLEYQLLYPRRLFFYLFPGFQTKALVFYLVVLICTEWVAFIVLDLGPGNPISSIPIGTRIADAFVQG